MTGAYTCLPARAASSNSPRERGLAVEREEDGNSLRAPEYIETSDAGRDRAVGGRALCGRQRAPLRPDPLPQAVPLGSVIGGDAPRLCRHEPLLSNRSNRWGRRGG